VEHSTHGLPTFRPIVRHGLPPIPASGILEDPERWGVDAGVYGTVTFRSSLNRVSVALGAMSLLEELRYLDKLCLLDGEHRDLENAVHVGARRFELAVAALPQGIAGADRDSWPKFRREITDALTSFLDAFDFCDFEAACRHLRVMRDSVAVSRSYLASHEFADAHATSEKPAGWSMNELLADMRANGIVLE